MTSHRGEPGDEAPAALFPLDGARCCSDIKLDRYLDGEMHGEALIALEAHLSTSPICRARADELRADRAEFASAAARVPAAPAANVTSLRAWSRRRSTTFSASAGALALAAAAVLFVVRGGDEATKVDVVRAKGSGVLTVHVLHDGAVRVAAPREQVAPGDRIQFTVRADSDAHVAVVGRDGAGVVSVYAAPVAVRAHVDTQLAGSIELDATPGDEELFAFFCDTAPAAETLATAVRSAARTSSRDALPRVAGCAIDPHALVKQASP